MIRIQPTIDADDPVPEEAVEPVENLNETAWLLALQAGRLSVFAPFPPLRVKGSIPQRNLSPVGIRLSARMHNFLSCQFFLFFVAHNHLSLYRKRLP